MTIHIRELALTLKETVKEKSLLELPVQSALENDGEYEQRLHEYEQRMQVLQERTYALRRQIDAKEQALVDCLQNKVIPPEQKDLQTTQEKREIK